jgi:phospholipid transport system substrate-binding protein
MMTLAALAVLAVPLRASAAADPAAAAVQSFYDRLQKILAVQNPDPKAKVGEIAGAVTESFDLGAMTRLAVGSRWRTIPADKQAKLQEAFARYFVASYSNSFGRAVGAKFEVNPTSEERTGGRLVRSKVVDPGGKPMEVNYLVSPEGKIVDIYFSGTVSELAAYRTDFEKTLAQGGPDALEANLRQRADQMASGAK